MTISYSIFPNQLSVIKGVLSDTPVNIGTGVTINGVDHEVKSCTFLQMKLFVSSNQLNMHFQDKPMISTPKSLKIVKNLGFVDQRSFIRSLFSRCEIVDMVAIREVYLVNFTDHDYLTEWN